MRRYASMSVLALVLLTGLTACGTSPEPTKPTDSAPSSPTAHSRATAQTDAGIGPMPDFVGGNVKGALMQLGPEADVRVTDSSGRDRSIDDEGDWKICTQQPSPGFLLNGHVVRFGAVLVGESC